MLDSLATGEMSETREKVQIRRERAQRGAAADRKS